MAATRLTVPKPNPLGGLAIIAAIWMIAVSLNQARSLWSAYLVLDTVLVAPLVQQIAVGFSVAGNAVLFVVVPIWSLMLMTDRSRKFPRVYVAWAVLGPVFFALDQLVAYVMYQADYDEGRLTLIDRGMLTAAIVSAVGLLGWVPYMVRSHRVRETFTS